MPLAGCTCNAISSTYTSKRVSATERHYRISQWESSASSIDESPDVILTTCVKCLTAMTGCSQRQRLNDKAILLSSINSPLWICTLKSGSKLD
ncbi:hypothetical protein DMI70_04085 [Escherichia coli]|nr:hypothetical protein [Escherichia coli]